MGMRMRALTCIAVCTTLFASIHSSCSPLRLQHPGEHTERLLCLAGEHVRDASTHTHQQASTNKHGFHSWAGAQRNMDRLRCLVIVDQIMLKNLPLRPLNHVLASISGSSHLPLCPWWQFGRRQPHYSRMLYAGHDLLGCGEEEQGEVDVEGGRRVSVWFFRGAPRPHRSSHARLRRPRASPGRHEVEEEIDLKRRSRSGWDQRRS